jgi:hypothetical protein
MHHAITARPKYGVYIDPDKIYITRSSGRTDTINI